LKDTFQAFVDKQDVPNLLLTGGPGCGKTTVAKAMLKEMGADSYLVNGSLDVNKDKLRTDISSYASSVSLMGGKKFVIIDEADYLDPNWVQPGLRGFVEAFSKNCGFILTCNYVNRLIEPIQSRMSIIDFKMTNKDKPEMAMGFMKRVMTILDTENVEYDKKVVAEIIQKHFPDYRRVLNELQRYSAANGKIDSGLLANLSEVKMKELMVALKNKEFTVARKWVAQNLDNDFNTLMRQLYDTAHEYIEPHDIPELVVLMADYQYKDAFVADKEVNTMALLVEIMASADFK
jgi:DNA polymerase III delta prime subunit